MENRRGTQEGGIMNRKRYEDDEQEGGIMNRKRREDDEQETMCSSGVDCPTQ